MITKIMSDPFEVVVCHDILQVPYADSSLLVWAATQTFTIQHLSEGADTICNNVPEDAASRPPLDEEGLLSSFTLEKVATPEPLPAADSNHTNSDGLLEIERQNYQTNNDRKDESITDHENEIPMTDNSLWKSVNDSWKEQSEKLHLHSAELQHNDLVAERYTGPRKKFASAAGEVPCGVCELKFKTFAAMHHHRVEHFGYFCGSDRTKKCVFCTESFQSVADLSEHLYEHYPKIMMKKPNWMNRTTRKSFSSWQSEEPVSSSSKPPSPIEAAMNPTRPILTASEPHCNGSSAIEEQNYPTTNNDRQKAEELKASNNEYKSNNKRKELDEFECGVCELKFDEIKTMHHHRIGHFGYFRSLTMPRKCVFCPERFATVSELSTHLFLHYPSLKQSFMAKIRRTNSSKESAYENV